MLYQFLRYLWFLASLLPLRIHYVFADILIYPLLFHVLRYRRRLVQRHLHDCFPEMNEKERAQLERRFYHYFADLLVEIVKEMSISEKEMRRRMNFVNLEETLRSFEQDPSQHYFVYLGHYGNWEWVASLPIWSKQDIAFGQIYHPLHNKALDRLFLSVRGRFGAQSIAMDNTLRTLLNFKREGRRSMVGFISDQVPRFEAMFHWQPFLNHDTSFFTGAEKIGKKLGARFFYLDITRPRRGYYLAQLRELHVPPNSTSPYPITDAYVTAFEQSIRRQPELWLWTHNRWKRTRNDWEAYHREREERLHKGSN